MLTPLNIMGPVPGGADSSAGKSSSFNQRLSDQGVGGFGDLFRNMKAPHTLPGDAPGTPKEAMKEGGVGIRGNLAGLLLLGDSASGGDIQALREKLQSLLGAIGQKGGGSNDALAGALLGNGAHKGDASNTDARLKDLTAMLERQGKAGDDSVSGAEALARALLGDSAHKGDASDTATRLKNLTAMLERWGKAGDDSVSGAEALTRALLGDARGGSGKSDGKELMARLDALIEQSASSKRDADETAEVGLVAVSALLRQGAEGVLAGDKGGRPMTAADAARLGHQLPGRETLMAALKSDESGEMSRFSRQTADGAERRGNGRDSQLITAVMERTTASRQAALDLQQSGTRSAAATPDAALSALTTQGGQAGSNMAATQGQAVTTATLPSMDSHQWSSALERQTINLGLRGGGEARLSMNPAELGPLSISLKMGEQGAQLHIGSHSAQVRAAIEAALPQLRDAFSASGIQLGDTSVSDQSAFEQRNFQHPGEGGGNGGRSSSATADMAALSTSEDDIRTLEIPAGRTLSGGIDLFA